MDLAQITALLPVLREGGFAALAAIVLFQIKPALSALTTEIRGLRDDLARGTVTAPTQIRQGAPAQSSAQGGGAA